MNYIEKDKLKFSKCTHIFGYGSSRSSSYKYITNPETSLGLDLSTDINSVNQDSIVGITAEGDRSGRAKLPLKLFQELVSRKPIFVTDNEYDTNRSYNVGEREVAAFLTKAGYTSKAMKTRTAWFLKGVHD